ncbi:MAG: dihydrolipoyl dehydrogenase family protein [Ilumatobacteraceae bacterium]
MAEPSQRSTDRYDLVVIGLGSGGRLASEFAVEQLGLRVAAVERDRVGGDCLWTGCVPSKTLLASARTAHTIRHADRLAIGAQPPEIDLTAVWRRIAAVQEDIATTDDDPDRLRSIGIDVVEGEARVTGAHEVTVGDQVLSTRYILVATGSRPLIPPLDGIAAADVLTSENLFAVERPPDSLVIVGGGPIGCEIAQALNRLGVRVVLVEAADRLLPRDDPEHAGRLADILEAEGVEVRLGRSVTRVRSGGEGVNVWIDGAGKVTAAGIFVAAGRLPNVEPLELDRLGIELTRDGVTVDDRNRTSVPSIYAVGDVTGRALFTHAAGYDGVLAVRDMFLPGRGTAPALVPWCTFTDPEVAHVGLTEAEAIERHGRRKVTVRRRGLEHSDRARAEATTDGEVAIVTAGGKIVGGHAISPRAGELIHELVLAIHAGMKLSDLAEMIHVYPTLSSEVGHLAADTGYEMARRARLLAKAGRLRR